MLNEMNYGSGDCSPKPAEATQQCKPDWESMIQRAKAELKRHEDFLGAIFIFNGNSRVGGKPAELVGEIYSTIVDLKEYIADLIEKQEADAE